MSKYDVFFKTKKLSINWIFLLIIINFFLHIFYIKSVYASEISYLDANFNGCCDYRPQHISKYNQSPKIPINSIDNQFAIFCGILCFPINCIWRTITFPCQDSLFCCDVLYARCAIIGEGSTCCGSSYYPDKFGICAEPFSSVSTFYSAFPYESNYYYGDLFMRN